MNNQSISQQSYLKRYGILIGIIFIPITIFIFTSGKYYGFYLDNHYYNLLGIDLLSDFKLYAYLGSHYAIHSSILSYLFYPCFVLLGPTDSTVQLVMGIMHITTGIVCYKLGEKFFNKTFGLILAAFISISPVYIINVYTLYERNFSAFLDLTSAYLFLMGLSERSRVKLILAAIIFSLSCLHGIYSLSFITFFTVLSFVYLFTLKEKIIFKDRFSRYSYAYKSVSYVFAFFLSLAFIYAILLTSQMYFNDHRVASRACGSSAGLPRETPTGATPHRPFPSRGSLARPSSPG